MKFQIHTLIDITETAARFDKNSPEWHQQQNYITMLNTIGLRANPDVEKSPEIMKVDSMKGLGFGTKFNGSNTVWKFEFTIEYGETSVEILTNDFDLVPVITDLDETAQFRNAVFETKDRAHKNIIFKLIV